MLLKNLDPGAGETVQVVVFAPKPRLIGLEMTPVGTQRMVAGDLARQAIRYALKPKVGVAHRFFVTVMGMASAILTEDVPAFVRCDGPLYVKGPVWRFEQTAAH